MMHLSKNNLGHISTSAGVELPGLHCFELPEKVLQFGTGVLLRGLPDYFIDKANKQGVFNGRIVMVKSTSRGDTNAFDQQDGLYTLCVRGMDNGREINEKIINAAVSRVLSAADEWDAVLASAANPLLQVVISNTTEVGISLVKESIRQSPPSSFPAKLLAFLFERFSRLGGTDDSGMVIIPTELIPGNGEKLQAILLELAAFNQLDQKFVQWLQTANHFCNSLVDRIVPGRLPEGDHQITEAQLGYRDELMIMAESYCLWAIETNSQKVKEVLSFHTVDDGVVIAPDIDIYRELKLRLLNGTHTFSCGLAYLAGYATVKEAMNDPVFEQYLSTLMQQEIAGAITSPVLSAEAALKFSGQVLDRFRNPFIDHPWINITVQYTSKMRMRNIPILLWHYERKGTVPVHMALGFAGYLLFMQCRKNASGQCIGMYGDRNYVIQDDLAPVLAGIWKNDEAAAVTAAALKHSELWGTDLTRLKGFAAAVKKYLESMIKDGVLSTITIFNQLKSSHSYEAESIKSPPGR